MNNKKKLRKKDLLANQKDNHANEKDKLRQANKDNDALEPPVGFLEVAVKVHPEKASNHAAKAKADGQQ